MAALPRWDRGAAAPAAGSVLESTLWRLLFDRARTHVTLSAYTTRRAPPLAPVVHSQSAHPPTHRGGEGMARTETIPVHGSSGGSGVAPERPAAERAPHEPPPPSLRWRTPMWLGWHPTLRGDIRAQFSAVLFQLIIVRKQVRAAQGASASKPCYVCSMWLHRSRLRPCMPACSSACWSVLSIQSYQEYLPWLARLLFLTSLPSISAADNVSVCRACSPAVLCHMPSMCR